MGGWREGGQRDGGMEVRREGEREEEKKKKRSAMV